VAGGDGDRSGTAGEDTLRAGAGLIFGGGKGDGEAGAGMGTILRIGAGGAGDWGAGMVAGLPARPVSSFWRSWSIAMWLSVCGARGEPGKGLVITWVRS
jgi:hypothetical protein